LAKYHSHVLTAGSNLQVRVDGDVVIHPPSLEVARGLRPLQVTVTQPCPRRRRRRRHFLLRNSLIYRLRSHCIASSSSTPTRTSALVSNRQLNVSALESGDIDIWKASFLQESDFPHLLFRRRTLTISFIFAIRMANREPMLCSVPRSLQANYSGYCSCRVRTSC
jgi:hypothetical protein